MHDKDCGGTIDVDECMEILFRRFGKDALEAKVNDFMSNDEDKDQTISFSEFLNMDRRNDKAGTRHHKGQLAPHTRRSLTSVGPVSEGAPSMLACRVCAGFKLTAGILATTRKENEKLYKELQGMK